MYILRYIRNVRNGADVTIMTNIGSDTIGTLSLWLWSRSRLWIDITMSFGLHPGLPGQPGHPGHPRRMRNRKSRLYS